MLEGEGSIGITSSKPEKHKFKHWLWCFGENKIGERVRASENSIPHEQIMTRKLVQCPQRSEAIKLSGRRVLFEF